MGRLGHLLQRRLVDVGAPQGVAGHLRPVTALPAIFCVVTACFFSCLVPTEPWATG